MKESKEPRPHLLHTLTSRHILMIALGSAISTGLFFSSAESIRLAGASILLAYTIGGIIMYIVVRALGEMVVYEPNVGSFSYYAYKYIGKYAGFMAGWNYWFNYIIVCMLELTASTMFLEYWFPNSPHWIMATIILIIFAFINLISVKFFGEFEFWFAGIKVVTILAFILLGIYLIATAGITNGASNDTINGVSNSVTHSNTSIHNLWQYGGFFAGGVKGFLFSFVIVVFSFGGTELVGIAAGESQNPHKVVPLAINGIIIRIILFYVATLTIIMCLYPWNKISNNISPFVDVFQKIGMAKAAAVMNLVAITAALSSFNSGIYGTARMLYNLGKQNNAPKYFTKLSKNGVPYIALSFSLVFIILTILLNYFYPKHVFNILFAIATIAAMFNWIIILVTQIKFRYSIPHAEHRPQLSYKLPLFPLLPIIAIVFFIIIMCTMYYMENMRLAIYIAPLWLLILSIGYLLSCKK
jgi:L-asparagine transporter-like permease